MLLPACGGQQAKSDNPDTTLTADAGAVGGAIKVSDAGSSMSDEERMRLEAEERRLQDQEMRDQMRQNRPRCTPDGKCPPYGAPPSPDDRIV